MPTDEDIHTILPSKSVRPSSADLARESADYSADESTHEAPTRISPTTLVRASQCLLRGMLAARGQKGVGPSPFSKATMEDGKEFEKSLFDPKNRALWIRAVNKAHGCHLPDDIEVVEAPDLRRGADETDDTFTGRIKKEFAKLLEGRKAPFVLKEPRLAIMEEGCLISGKPDLLIHTSNEWILGDIKCSEEGRRTHGIQIAAYDRMLGAMGHGPRHPLGVVVHCATGFRFTATSTEATKEECLTHTQATAFPIEALAPSVEALLKQLRDTSNAALEQAEAQAVFSSVCNECEYRVRCYPRFVEQKHVSLLPVGKAQVKVLLDAGLLSIDDVLQAIDDEHAPARSTLVELLEGSQLQLNYLRQKAEFVREKAFYSAWRSPVAVVAKPLLFASAGDDGQFEPPLEEAESCRCLVVYTESERRKAWARMLARPGGSKDIQRSYVLAEEIQQTVHGLIPSLTLTPMVEFVKWSSAGGSLDTFNEWFCNSYGNQALSNIQESATSADRVNQLKATWSFLSARQTPRAQ